MAERTSVVLISGLLCDGEIWAEQERALSARYDVLTLGFMRFSTIEAMAEEVLRVAPPRFSVAGHSMGGRVALEIVRRAPERVQGLALIDTGFSSARPGEETGRYALVTLAEEQGMTALAAAWLPPMVSARRTSDCELIQRLTRMVERADFDLFRGQIHALLKRPNAEPMLGAIDCPTCVIVGRDDSWSPVEQHRAMAAQIPAATLDIIEDCGHMSLVEQPKVINFILMSWMERPMTTMKLDHSSTR